MSPKMTDDETDNFTSHTSPDRVWLSQASVFVAPCNHQECTFARKSCMQVFCSLHEWLLYNIQMLVLFRCERCDVLA